MAALKILRISADHAACIEGSQTFLRLQKHGELVGELHALVYADASLGYIDKQISKNVWVYPITASDLFRSGAAARLGEKIVFDRKFVRGESVIIAEDPFDCGSAGSSIKRRWKLPLLVECNSNLSHLPFLKDRAAKKVLRQADALSAASTAAAEAVAKYLGIEASAIHIDPLYIDAQKIESSRESFDLHARYPWKFIMLAAAMRDPEDKNFIMALEVLSKLKEYFPQIGLVMLGARAEEKFLMQEARKLGVASQVAFAPHEGDWASYYRTANLFLQTSTFEVYSEELVTAGLLGLPLVATATGVAARLENGRDALICPPGDAEYMFRAVYDLMHTEGLYSLLRTRIRGVMEEIVASHNAAMGGTFEYWNHIARMVSSSHG